MGCDPNEKVTKRVLYSGLDKRLLGPKRKLQEMAFKVLGGGLDKRLLGVGVVWTKASLVLIQPWHQGVFCPNHPSTKESFVQTTPFGREYF